ncbi:hypothetical protein [Actinomadura atramentaria]|uniref:hypothetical protein n=1 Tax=Actinomadura atramentaria TaxID=1990 RepID=UPI0003691EF3|nr:hypothetical protein [Actinomadura atramentaria]
MLFSIPDSRWWIVAVGATVFFVAGLRLLAVGVEFPPDVRAEMKQQRSKGRVLLYGMTPVLCAAILGVNLLRPERTAEILFLYSVVFVAIPLALYPVRGRMVRDYLARRENPDAEVKTDVVSTVWIVTFLCVVLFGAVIALMAATYTPD